MRGRALSTQPTGPITTAVFLSSLHQQRKDRGRESASDEAPTHGRKHPALAGNARGETILAWTEGTGWNKGGSLAWQVYDKDGKPTAEHGRAAGVPTWSLVAVFARPDGGFTILY